MTPLVFLPGLLCDAALWRHQLDSLGDVAAMQVPKLTGQDSIAAMAAHVLAGAPQRFALAGLSMGGYVAQEIMRQAPERVLGLAFINSNARADRPEQAERRRAFIDLVAQGKFGLVPPQLMPGLVHPDRLADEGLTRRIRAMAEAIGPEAFVRQQKAIISRVDGRDDLRRINCPAIVIGGRQDSMMPPKVHAEMAELIPGAKLVIIEECGHLSPLEQPQAVSALLRLWLQMF